MSERVVGGLSFRSSFICTEIHWMFSRSMFCAMKMWLGEWHPASPIIWYVLSNEIPKWKTSHTFIRRRGCWCWSWCWRPTFQRHDIHISFNREHRDVCISVFANNFFRRVKTFSDHWKYSSIRRIAHSTFNIDEYYTVCELVKRFFCFFISCVYYVHTRFSEIDTAFQNAVLRVNRKTAQNFTMAIVHYVSRPICFLLHSFPISPIITDHLLLLISERRSPFSPFNLFYFFFTKQF